MPKEFPSGIWAIASHFEKKSDVDSFILRTQGAAVRTWRRPQMLAREAEESLLALVEAGNLFCHGQLDWALAMGATGTICGAYSLPIEVVLKQKKSDFLVGASVHSLEESEAALASGCDFLVFGPVWDTPSKIKFMPARGLDELSEVVALGAPVVGIGGIEKPSQIKELHKLKVKGAAVLRACEETEKFNSLVEAWLTG